MGFFNLSVKGVDLNEVKRELISGIHAKDVLAAVEMQRAATRNAQLHRLLGSGTRGGSFGEVKMRLPVHVALAWKQREGNDVMHDPFWQAYMRKHFPEMFPRSRSAKLESTVLAPGRESFTAKNTENTGNGLLDRCGRPIVA